MDASIERCLSDAEVMVRACVTCGLCVFVLYSNHYLCSQHCTDPRNTQRALATKVTRERVGTEYSSMLGDSVKHIMHLAAHDPIDVVAGETPLDRCVLFARWLCSQPLYGAVFNMQTAARTPVSSPTRSPSPQRAPTAAAAAAVADTEMPDLYRSEAGAEAARALRLVVRYVQAAGSLLYRE